MTRASVYLRFEAMKLQIYDFIFKVKTLLSFQDDSRLQRMIGIAREHFSSEIFIHSDLKPSTLARQSEHHMRCFVSFET